MRVHPISIALAYLKGKRRWHQGPYNGESAYKSETEAIAVLRMFTGQDFGNDAKKWGEWLRKNRSVYYRLPDQDPGTESKTE